MLAKSEPSVKLPGIEIRCPNKIVKTYEGLKKVKRCGALLAVVTSAGYGGQVTVDVKCWRCKNMVRHQIN